MLEFVKLPSKIIAKEKEIFFKTFTYISENIGPDCFKRFDSSKNLFLGGFLISAFETVALGVGFNIDGILSAGKKYKLKDRVKKVWSNQDFKKSIGGGINASTRIRRTVPLGRKIFKY